MMPFYFQILENQKRKLKERFASRIRQVEKGILLIILYCQSVPVKVTERDFDLI